MITPQEKIEILKMNGASQRCLIGALSLTSLFFLCCLFPSVTAHAQKVDTSNKLNIEILPGNGTNLQYIQTDSGAMNKLINNVQLRQGETYMYCDSAYINLAKNNLQAFGNVRIVQTGGTQVESDYLRYTGNTKKAFLQGNVNLTDGKANLWSEELNYDVGTKIGTYSKGGTLQSETTTLSSNGGFYNAATKDSRFTGDVYVTDPKYNVVSEDLAYNTATEVVKFLAPSVVTNDSAELRTSSGTWDAKNEIAHFTTRSSLQDRAQYIEADKMDYNRVTGFGVANGKVVCIDTALKGTLYCDHAQYNELTKKLYATEYPVMKKMNGTDSLFIRADTFFSAPVVTKDSIVKDTSSIKKGSKLVKKAQAAPATDSSGKRYFLGYHHVLVFSDSLQAKCDSISYSQEDSTMRLMYSPMVWSRNAQITGDTILLYTDSNTLRQIYVPNNALLISQSGPEKAQLFDQVQGKTLTGFFENGTIREMLVYPNAEAIYYSKDDKDAYIGVDETQSERMKVIFEDKEISRILQYQNVRHKMTPMQQALGGVYRLSRFQWLAAQRPKSLKELFEYGKTARQEKSSVTGKDEVSQKKEAQPKQASKRKRSRK
ncbi:MAG TPA: OstA-like protein [Flavipsychrobacter sp.]|nr:OstA-like protein [Flavipsychrobacter sp.]